MFEYFRLWVQARVKNVTPKNVIIFGGFWKKNLGNPLISSGDMAVYFWVFFVSPHGTFQIGGLKLKKRVALIQATEKRKG